MSFSYDFPSGGTDATYMEMQAQSQRAKTYFTYPNPADIGTQAFCNPESTFLGSWNHADQYPQPWVPYANEIQGESIFIPDFMSLPGPILPDSGQGMGYDNPYQDVPSVPACGVTYQVPQSTEEIANGDTTLEEDRTYPGSGRRKLSREDYATDAERVRGSDRSTPQGPSSKKKSSTRQRAAPAARRARPSKPPRAARKGGRISKLGQKKAALGCTAGSDYRRRAEVRWEDGVMFGLDGDDWKPAAYHSDFREKLILIDAQQPGAPVWRQGMSLNYTSYSPISHAWTGDPYSMTDSRGRHAFLMPTPPTDWIEGPDRASLMCDGLIMLDQNNRPVKDYPGAPLTLGSQNVGSPGWLVEGLRRYFGMTYPDMRARMPLETDTLSGKKPLTGNSFFGNRVKRWISSKQSVGMRPWHKRAKRKTTGDDVTAPSDLLDEQANTTESTPASEPALRLESDESSSSYPDYFSSSMPEVSVAMSVFDNLMQPEIDFPFIEDNLSLDQSWLLDQPLLWPELDLSLGAGGDPGASGDFDFQAQLSPGSMEQTKEGNQHSAFAFQGANTPPQTANSGSTDSTYSPGYPSRYAPGNIYSQDDPFGWSTRNNI